ncbi:MAG: metal ABC transporter permease [Planctomycetes bacterium]|nr:metal ABC transporter permease [Planctomycetota bacterium]
MNTLADMLAGREIAMWTIALSALSNVACALLGCYLLLRRMSMMGDAISHSVLPGIVGVFLWAGTRDPLPMFLGAVAMGLAVAWATQTLHDRAAMAEDASMGIVYTSCFALGLVMLSAGARLIDLDPSCVLYGNLETLPLDVVTWRGLEVPRALGTLLPACILTVSFVVAFWKELKISSFDPALASAMGLSAMVIHYALMSMVAVVTVASFEVAGSLIVVAMLIVPAATAHLLSDRLGNMLVIAAVVAVLASTVGYFAAVACDTNVAGMTAVVAGGELALAVVFSPRHGLITKAALRLGLAVRIAGEDVIAALYRAEEAAATESQPAAGASTNRLNWRQCVATAPGRGTGTLAIWSLVRRGALSKQPDGYALTEAGRSMAQSLVRSHRLWEAYLTENFQLPLDHLHAPAERVEHFIGPELQQQLAEEVVTTHVDPHGRTIPEAQQPPN